LEEQDMPELPEVQCLWQKERSKRTWCTKN